LIADGILLGTTRQPNALVFVWKANLAARLAGTEKMKPFQKVRQPNGVLTTYWRCSLCAHIRIIDSTDDDPSE
jgi:hypothetical protein